MGRKLGFSNGKKFKKNNKSLMLSIPRKKIKLLGVWETLKKQIHCTPLPTGWALYSPQSKRLLYSMLQLY